MNALTAALKEELNVEMVSVFGLSIPESVVVSWGIMAFLVLGSILLTRNLRVEHITKRQAVLETVVTTINDFFIGLLGEKYGAPYNQFPFAMLEVGKGGISDWGTICGALLGPASAYALFWGRKERNAMVSELYRWYETAKLPIFNPGEAAKGVKGDLPTSVADSVLCHVSLSRWCFENKVEANSKARSERCGRLTADVTYKAVEIMNAKIDGTFKPALAAPQSVTTCGECHAKGKEADNMKSVMDCTPCHSGNEHLMNKFKDHP